jgi:hypothetical protein
LGRKKKLVMIKVARSTTIKGKPNRSNENATNPINGNI